MIAANKMLLYNPVMHIRLDTATFGGWGGGGGGGGIINKCMAYINIAFDSGQVAGWEQMLGAGRGSGLNREGGERVEEGEKKSFSKVLRTMAADGGNCRRLADAGNWRAFGLSKQLVCRFIHHSVIFIISQAGALVSRLSRKSPSLTCVVSLLLSES